MLDLLHKSTQHKNNYKLSYVVSSKFKDFVKNESYSYDTIVSNMFTCFGSSKKLIDTYLHTCFDPLWESQHAYEIKLMILQPIDQQHVVACCVGTFEIATQNVDISDVCVAKHARGKGVCGALISEVLNHFKRDKKVKSISIYCERKNKAACACYSKYFGTPYVVTDSEVRFVHDKIRNKIGQHYVQRGRGLATISVYTDGSCSRNGKYNATGGIGVYFGPNDSRNISKYFDAHTLTRYMRQSNLHADNYKVTNQVMELIACVEAINTAIKSSQRTTEKALIHLFSDSDYVVKSMNTWAKTWIKNGWKTKFGTPIANQSLMKTLYSLKLAYDVRFEHVPAHQSEPKIIYGDEQSKQQHTHWLGNMMADRLATSASPSFKH